MKTFCFVEAASKIKIEKDYLVTIYNASTLALFQIS